MTITLRRMASKISSRRFCVRKYSLLWFDPGKNNFPILSRYATIGRLFSSDDSKSSSPLSGTEWRKQQLDKIENKFKGKQTEILSIESEEDLQPMWKEMEGRVTRRKPRSLADTGGKSGRMNIKKTDEDIWLKEGLYSAGDDRDSSKNE